MYLGMHNDASFPISNELNFYGQQSAYNPNMPGSICNQIFFELHSTEVKGMLLTE